MWITHCCTNQMMKLIFCLSQPDEWLEYSCTSLNNMPRVSLDLFRERSDRNCSTSLTWQPQSYTVACETFWRLVMIDFTYGCTWRWCAGSWAAAACTREFSSHGRQTWRRGLFSPCTPSPGNGRISSCCPVGKPEYIWAINKGGIHWSEVAEFQVQPVLTCTDFKVAKCNVAMHNALTCRSNKQLRHVYRNSWIHSATGYLEKSLRYACMARVYWH